MKHARWGAVLCMALLVLTGTLIVPLSPALAGSPVNQRVTNLSASGATIVWDSSASETGSITYGGSCAALTGNATTDGGIHILDNSGDHAMMIATPHGQ